MHQNKRNKKRVIALLMALALASSLAVGCGKKDEAAPAPGAETPAAPTGDASEVLVAYKGGKVTRAEFDKFVGINMVFYPQYEQFKTDAAFQQDIMNQLIVFRIMGARANDTVKAEADKRATEQMEQIKMYLGMQEGGMDKVLKDANVTEQDLHEFVKGSMMAMIQAESEVTEDKVKAAYDNNLKQDADMYTVATVRHVLVGTTDAATGQASRTKEEALARAKEVQQKLTGGGDFDALAKEYSDDPGSKDSGGKYENAEVSQWVPEFKKAAIELPIGKISDPVETSFGYHVMKVESRSTKSYDEVKEGLRSEAAQNVIYDFLEKELPGLIESNKLPKPEPAAPAPATEAPKTEEKK
ncbi:peptidylprolyl isomerase [Paenibacillus sp. YYML68]|uniref:peptidylprolyl isomerase n=1 Tax=Paenibacillus sp. YYML68 TaxID=2909250 RepID=UPI002492A7BC|nr:peptidylprolyl isomerase [Paenibacillus sp. YYML68]